MELYPKDMLEKGIDLKDVKYYLLIGLMVIICYAPLSVSLFAFKDRWEILGYTIIAGIGFFKLCRFFDFGIYPALLLAMCYACCGFIVDSRFFLTLISSAAFLPFVLLYFIKTIKEPQYFTSVKLGLSLSLLFLTGYPGSFMIAAYILLFTSLVYLGFSLKDQKKKQSLEFLKQIAIALVLVPVICGGAAVLTDYFPLYAGPKGLIPQTAQASYFDIDNSVSYLFPPASYKLFTQNDISARNAFIGLVPMLFFFYSLKYGFSRYQDIIAGITILCFLLSLGDTTPLQPLFSRILPFLGGFAHPAAIRLFTTIGLLLLAGFGMKQFIQTGSHTFLNKIIYTFTAVSLIYITYNLFFANGRSEISGILASFEPSARSLKGILERSQFSFWLILAGMIQLAFLLALLLIKRDWFLWVAGVANVLIMVYLCMPLHLLSQYERAKHTVSVHSSSGQASELMTNWRKSEEPQQGACAHPEKPGLHAG